MTQSFYFYDVETSGLSPKEDRIMQFAGLRTDLNLKPIGEPDNIYIKLSDDILPTPDAILITCITPQKTRVDGITEAEFLKYFHSNIATPGTIFTGYNNIRFDDEFLRYTNYRNFYDAYEWAWQDNKSRWDLLDVIRMTRALRPSGIKWPVASDGRPSNRLELLTGVNKLEHTEAHDALSDVRATIAIARLINNKQPKLFSFLLNYRHKQKVKELVEANRPFVFSSGHLPSANEKTSVMINLGTHTIKKAAVIYDLRYDPAYLAKLSPAEIAVAWYKRPEEESKRLPVYLLKYNRCPAVAPISVLDKESLKNIKLTLKKIDNHVAKLKKYPDLLQKLLSALSINEKQSQAELVPNIQTADTQLYDGFFDDQDRISMSVVRAAESDEIGSLDIEFKDQRLEQLLALYKARNFPSSLTHEERVEWEKYRHHKLIDGGNKSQAARYFARLSELSLSPLLNQTDRFLLQELQLYGESILPDPEQL